MPSAKWQETACLQGPREIRSCRGTLSRANLIQPQQSQLDSLQGKSARVRLRANARSAPTRSGEAVCCQNARKERTPARETGPARRVQTAPVRPRVALR